MAYSVFREPSPEDISRRNSSFSCFAGEGLVQHFVPINEIPPRNDITKMEVDEAVKQINDIILGTNFSSMKIGFCYISEEYFDEDELVSTYLRGVYNTHNIPGGCIQYKECYENIMECCSMQHMLNKSMLDIKYIINNFPKQVMIPRTKRPEDTKPRFSAGRIIDSSGTVFSTTRNTINVFVEFLDWKEGLKFKTIGLKELMDANNVRSIEIAPKVFSDSYISSQEDNIRNLLNYYNTEFKKFISNEICEKLNEGNIPYTLKYTFFEF